MPVSVMMDQQDFPRGGGGVETRPSDHETFIRKKKKKSKVDIIDSIGSDQKKSRDDLIREEEEDDEDNNRGGGGSDDEVLGDNLFKVAKPKPTKKTRDRARTAAAAAADKEEEEEEEDFIVEPLTFDTIQEGLLSLGVVHEVRDHEVIVTLPGRTAGAIPMTAVSTPYTNLLSKIESGESEISALAPLQQLFNLGQILIIRVIKIEESETLSGSVRRKIVLSSNPQDLHQNYNATLVEEGMQFTSAVQSVEDHGLVMDIGVCGVRSFLPRNRLPAKQYNEIAIGQLIQCKVVLAKVQRLLCNVTLQAIPSGGRAVPNLVEDENMNSSLLLPGMVFDSHIMQIHKTGLKIYFMELMGSVHQDHTSQPWELPLDHEKYKQVQATLLYTHPMVGTLPSLTLKRDLCPGRVHSAGAYSKGVSYDVIVERFEKRGLVVRFENGEKGIVSTRRCFPPRDKKQDTSPSAISSTFPPGSKHRCRLLEYSEVDSVYVGSFAQANAPESTQGGQQPTPGSVLKCTLVEWKRSGALVRLQNTRSLGFIHNLHFDKYDEIKTRKRHHPEGSVIKSRLIRCDGGKLLLTARKKLIQYDGAVIENVKECKLGILLTGMVFKSSSKGLVVSLIGGVMGFSPASLLDVPSDYIERQYPPGEIVQVRVVEVEPERPTLIFSLVGVGEEELVVPKIEEQTSKKKTESRRRQSESTSESEMVEIKEEEPTPLKLKRTISKLRPSSSSFWEDDQEEEKHTPEVAEQIVPPKKSKKHRLVESEARQLESSLADPTRPPTTRDDYELLLLASPSSSMAWIKYISMHLEAGNLQEARSVGDRALTTIPFNEEQERLNLWTALLNLENEHGTPETLKARFSSALRNCDELSIYKQMASIYTSSKKNEEARQLLRAMTKKFPTHLQIWSMAAVHLYKTGEVDEGRALYNRAVSALPARNHVEMISKFAQLELAYGDFEQGRALYEKLVNTYHTRVDIWLVYINQLIKQRDYAGARMLFERVTNFGSVNPRRMQPIFKRWLEFERESGTLESLAGVEGICAGYYKERLGLSVVGGGEEIKMEEDN